MISEIKASRQATSQRRAILACRLFLKREEQKHEGLGNKEGEAGKVSSYRRGIVKTELTSSGFYLSVCICVCVSVCVGELGVKHHLRSSKGPQRVHPKVLGTRWTVLLILQGLWVLTKFKQLVPHLGHFLNNILCQDIRTWFQSLQILVFKSKDNTFSAPLPPKQHTHKTNLILYVTHLITINTNSKKQQKEKITLNKCNTFQKRY